MYVYTNVQKIGYVLRATVQIYRNARRGAGGRFVGLDTESGRSGVATGG